MTDGWIASPYARGCGQASASTFWKKLSQLCPHPHGPGHDWATGRYEPHPTNRPRQARFDPTWLGCVLLGTAALALALATSATGDASHAGWPKIDGKLIINKQNLNETMHGDRDLHNELLGGNGDDTIYGGQVGDGILGRRRAFWSAHDASRSHLRGNGSTSSTPATAPTTSTLAPAPPRSTRTSGTASSIASPRARSSTRPTAADTG